MSADRHESVLTSVEIEVFNAMVGVGKFDHVDERITAELFWPRMRTTPARKPAPAQFLKLSHRPSLYDAGEELRRRGLRPGTFQELLAFGTVFKKYQRKCVVIALGSVVEIDGKRHVAALDGNVLWRGLILCPCNVCLGPDCRLLFSHPGS